MEEILYNAIHIGGSNVLCDLNINSIRRTSDCDEIVLLIQLSRMIEHYKELDENSHEFRSISKSIDDILSASSSVSSYNINTY